MQGLYTGTVRWLNSRRRYVGHFLNAVKDVTAVRQLKKINVSLWKSVVCYLVMHAVSALGSPHLTFRHM